MRMAATEHPFMIFETTTIFLPQDFTSHDLEFLDRKDKRFVGEQIDKNTQKDAMKVNENPYWFEFDGASMLRDSSQQHHHQPENAHHHHHHNTRRAKRNHKRKLKAASHSAHNDAEKISVAKRSISIDYQDEDLSFIPEVYSASEVIGNIFNENDTVQDPLKASGKYDGM